MTLSENLMRTLARASQRLALLGLLVIAPYAHAGWTLVRADTPITTIHAASVYQAEAGQRFAPDDLVENLTGGVAQLQDESGNLIALGPDTRAMLTGDAHIALLRGWLKMLHTCSVANCATPVVETARTRITVADHAALVIAAAPSGYASADAVFCESGAAQLLALDKAIARAAEVRLDAHQFALRAQANQTFAVSASPTPDFVAAMPLPFRDALRPLPVPASPRNPPAHGQRPVAYDDVADWLSSALAVRTAQSTRFTVRFRARLSDPSFRRAVQQHVNALPDWQPLVSPQPRRVSRSPAAAPPSAYPGLLVRP
jgi:hypothetical protein